MDLLTAPHPALPLGEPFTPAMAARAGIGRATLDRMFRAGRVLRLLRGVYVDANLASTCQVRARALALVLGPTQVVVGRTAAWLHGAVTERTEISVEVDGRRRRSRAPVPPLLPGDISTIGQVRCTSALRTALDLSHQLAPERALPLLDGLLRVGAMTHGELVRACLAASPRAWPAIAQVRELTALADGRSQDLAESILRLRWLEAYLPTPVPGIAVDGVRLALGLGPQRYGAALTGQLRREDLERCKGAGWHVAVLHPARVLASDPEDVGQHLQREFHQHLLRQVG